jgi:hypothetical protein
MSLPNYSQLVSVVRCLSRKVNEDSGGGGGTYTAGTGLQLVGTEFSVVAPTALTTGTLAQFAATTSAQLATLITNETGSGSLVFGTNPNMDGPRIINGIQGATGIKILDFATVGGAVNGLQATASSTGSGPTLTVQGSDSNIDLNLAAVGTGAVKYLSIEIGFRTVPSNSQSANYTTVLADNGKAIDHPASDNNARAFTIDGSLAYPIGTCITFTNLAATACTIPITTDVMYLAGTGTTGTRTLAQYGMAMARKTAAGFWMISGSGLT